MLATLEQMADRRLIQGVDEGDPERGTHAHHAYHQNQRHAQGCLRRNHYREHAEVEECPFWVQDVVDESLNEPSPVTADLRRGCRVERRRSCSKTYDAEENEIHGARVLQDTEGDDTL